MISATSVIGLLLLLSGIALRLFVGKRRFNRRGIGGMEHFRSYWAALILTFLEWLASIAAMLMILSGLLLLLVTCYHRYVIP